MDVTKNETLAEVDHPETRARLTGLQEAVLEFDQEVLNLRKVADQKKMIGSSCRAISERVFGECQAIQKRLDQEVISPEEAKIRIDQIQKIVGVIRAIEADANREMIEAAGRVAGLELAAKMTAKRFEDTVQKFERHKRMEAEDEGFRDDTRDQATPPKGDAAGPGVVPLTQKKGGKKGKKKG